MTSLVAVKGIRGLLGGSQSLLVEASDGERYVVKCRNNPQGDRVCFNEGFASLLANRLELPTPSVASITFDKEFIIHNQCHWTSRQKQITWIPSEGRHFASRLVENTPSLAEVLPSTWFPQIMNRDTFLSMLIFDMWADHVDHRQAVFTISAARRIHVAFLDNGYMFGGPSTENTLRVRPLFRNRSIYSDIVVGEASFKLAETILSWNYEVLWITAQQLPHEWLYPGVFYTLIRLSKRRSLVEKILRRFGNKSITTAADLLGSYDVQ